MAVIHPLVVGNQRALRIHQVRDGILCQDNNAVGRNQLRNVVVDLWVCMVRASCQDDTVAAVLFQLFDDLLAFLLHIGLGRQQFLPAEFTGFFYFGSRNIELLLKDLNIGIHENRAAGAEIDRIGREQRFLCEILYFINSGSLRTVQ